jgi:predicted transcriptional regulator of viral defense system
VLQSLGAGGGACQKTSLHNYPSFLYIYAMPHSVQSAHDSLFKFAEEQQGYFTAKQAVEVGYLPGSQAYHVKAGNWVRVERGIYRLGRYPRVPDEQLVIYSLWSRNRSGEIEGVYSHQTALSIHELSDINPVKLHLTVPPTFRRSAKTPKILFLHRGAVDEKDVEQRQGFKITRPLKTIVDLASLGSVSREIIAQALTEGRRSGLITARELSEACRSRGHPDWFRELLAKAEK